MAIGTSSTETSPAGRGKSDVLGSEIVEYDRYIDRQLHRTRRHVKGVDLSSSLMLLSIASLVYLMVVALADQWVVKGGLTFAGRMIAFGVLIAGVGAFSVFRLLPLALRRVSPVYAAYTIERHRPGLKNSLINFLLLRSGNDRVPERIYEAIEVQAANALSSAHTEVAVDRRPLIRLLMALVAVIFFLAMYAVFSPKNPFTSIRRVISPWSDVAAPTRVMIGDIQPGDATGFHDQHLAVSAQISGARPGEQVTLRYSTVDGQVVARAVPMKKPEKSYRHTAELPPDNLGLQQDLEYWIEAGDAISPHYQIKVDTAPAIVVEKIEYEYPKYAEMPPQTVERHGDIQALAGTRVTLRAKANQPIRQASLDFECDGRNDLDMQVDGTQATVSFALAWNESLRKADHESYQLRFRNRDGHENPKPIRYSIEVIRDLPPEVDFVEPELDEAKELVVPAGQAVRFRVEASDPDFKLAGVKFHARRGRTPLAEDSLLAEPRGGQFRRDYLFDVKRLEVKPGEEIEFWAAADDNREPKANHSETSHYRLRVAADDQQEKSKDDQNAGQPNQNQQSKPDQQKQNQQGKRNSKDQQQGDQEGQPGEQQQKGDQQRDNKKQPGENDKNVNKNNRQKGQKGDADDQQQSQQGGQGDQRNSSDQPQSGDGDSSQKNQGKSGSGDNQQGEGQQGQGQQGEGQQDDGQSGSQKTGKSNESKRVDPDRDAGKAIDEINNFFNDKEKKDGNEKQDQPKQDQPSDEQQGNKQSGDKSQKQDRDQQQQSQAGQQGDESQEGGQQGKKSQESKTSGKPNEKQSSQEQGANSGAQENASQQSGQSGKKQQVGKERQADSQQSESQEPNASRGDKGKGDKQQAQTSGEKAEPKEGDEQQEKSGSEGTQGQQQSDKKNGEGRSADQHGEDHENAAKEGEKSEGKKQGAKAGKQPSNGEQTPNGDEQNTANEKGDKSDKEKSKGGKQGKSQTGNEQSKGADRETKPRDGQGGQAKGSGERDNQVKKQEGQSPDQKGGDPESKDKGEAGAGNNEKADKQGSPSSQGDSQDRKKDEGSPDGKSATSEEEAEPSSDSKHQSDSQSSQSGERDGEGKAGGGQRSDSQGTGSAGQNSDADEGGGKGEKQGKGAMGKKGGDQQKSQEPTGGKQSGEKGRGSKRGGKEGDESDESDSSENSDQQGQKKESTQRGQRKEKSDENAANEPRNDNGKPSAKKSDKKQADGTPQRNADNEAPRGEPKPSERGGHDVSGRPPRSNPTDGGEPGPEETTPPDELDQSEPGGDDPNQDYARKATDLAIERLKDQLAKEPDPDLLKKLGWTSEDMERFVKQWDRLKKAADEAGPKGDAARQELDDALRSLGLRPRGSSLAGGKKREQGLRVQEGRRTAPPPEYQDQYREFNKARAKGTK